LRVETPMEVLWQMLWQLSRSGYEVWTANMGY
jgi:hypothetical protein